MPEIVRYVLNGLVATAVHFAVLAFNLHVLVFPSAGLANLVAGRKIVPELLQSEATPEKLAESAYFYLKEPLLSSQLKEKLRVVREKLGSPGALPQIAASFCRLV